MAEPGKTLTAGDYIGHHLIHLQNKDVKQSSIVDFSYFNIDTIFWAITLGVIGCFVMWRVAKNVHAGVPGRMQAAVEILLEMVDNQAKGIVKNAESRKMVGPLALTVFIWIFLMNSMDFLPVDFLPKVWELIVGAGGGDPHHAYMRVVPTADLSTTLGLSVSVLLVCIFYNIKIKGFGHWIHELFTAPFGAKLGPINFLFQMIEFVAKTVSHGMRLFGNMYAGELLFMLIALMGGSLFTMTGQGFMLGIGQVLAGTVWSIFHILIVALQAFVFMMLTLVYIGQAHDAH